MKKVALVVCLCVGISSGVCAQEGNPSWWQNKWIWIGLVGATAGAWAWWKGYFKRPLSTERKLGLEASKTIRDYKIFSYKQLASRADSKNEYYYNRQMWLDIATPLIENEDKVVTAIFTPTIPERGITKLSWRDHEGLLTTFYLKDSDAVSGYTTSNASLKDHYTVKKGGFITTSFSLPTSLTGFDEKEGKSIVGYVKKLASLQELHSEARRPIEYLVIGVPLDYLPVGSDPTKERMPRDFIQYIESGAINKDFTSLSHIFIVSFPLFLRFYNNVLVAKKGRLGALLYDVPSK